MPITDYILNGEAHGDAAGIVAQAGFDVGLLQPYINEHGHKCMTVNTGETRFDKERGIKVPVKRERKMSDLTRNNRDLPLGNAASLRKDEWIMLDRVVLRAARERLSAWADLAAASTFGGFNGMATPILQYEAMNDPGEAIVDMDGLTEGRNDAPRFALRGLPLPLIHSDFFFSSRRLAASRNIGSPLDSTMAEAAGRRVAEKIEQMVIGVDGAFEYGDTSELQPAQSGAYGYLNFPQRAIKNDVTVPDGTNAAATIDDVLEMRETLYNNNYFGPFMLYHSTDWDKFMDDDYILTGGNVATQTLRERLRAISGITDVKRLDFLKASQNPFTLVLVQMTSDVARAVNGMSISTVQWETRGGMQMNFRVMAIQVPQLRADFTDQTGIIVGTTS